MDDKELTQGWKRGHLYIVELVQQIKGGGLRYVKTIILSYDVSIIYGMDIYKTYAFPFYIPVWSI